VLLVVGAGAAPVVAVVDTDADGRIATPTTTATVRPAVRDLVRLKVGPDVARRQPS
jgi:protein subunit release factor A